MVLGNHPLVKAPGNFYQWMTHQPNSLNFTKEKKEALPLNAKQRNGLMLVHLSWFLLSVCIGWQGCVPHPVLYYIFILMLIPLGLLGGFREGNGVAQYLYALATCCDCVLVCCVSFLLKTMSSGVPLFPPFKVLGFQL